MVQDGFQFTVVQRPHGPTASADSHSIAQSGTQAGTAKRPTESHYWISTYPFFAHSLLVVPPPHHSSESDSGFTTSLTLYDADGMLANQLTIQRDRAQITNVELDPLMGGCKIESGLKHGHLLVSSPPGFTHICRVLGPQGNTLITPGTPLSRDLSSFMPLTFSAERTHLLALINTSDQLAQVRCRLYCGKRTPESSTEVPARGMRLLSVQAEFSDFAVVEGAKRVNAYARLTTGSERPLFVQMIERYELVEDAYRYAAVS